MQPAPQSQKMKTNPYLWRISISKLSWSWTWLASNVASRSVWRTLRADFFAYSAGPCCPRKSMLCTYSKLRFGIHWSLCLEDGRRLASKDNTHLQGLSARYLHDTCQRRKYFSRSSAE